MSLPLEVAADRLERADRERIEEIIGAAVPRVAPTLALVVWSSGTPVLDLRAGWMDPDRRLRATRPDALFDLASVTKTITATLFLRLVSSGRVGLDDPVVSVIPELGEGGPRSIEGGQEPLTRVRLPTPARTRGLDGGPGRGDVPRAAHAHERARAVAIGLRGRGPGAARARRR